MYNRQLIINLQKETQKNMLIILIMIKVRTQLFSIVHQHVNFRFPRVGAISFFSQLTTGFVNILVLPEPTNALVNHHRIFAVKTVLRMGNI